MPTGCHRKSGRRSSRRTQPNRFGENQCHPARDRLSCQVPRSAPHQDGALRHRRNRTSPRRIPGERFGSGLRRFHTRRWPRCFPGFPSGPVDPLDPPRKEVASTCVIREHTSISRPPTTSSPPPPQATTTNTKTARVAIRTREVLMDPDVGSAGQGLLTSEMMSSDFPASFDK